MILGPCFYDLNKSICVCVWTQKNKKRRKFAEADNGKPSVTDRLHITQKLRLEKCSGESIIKVKLGAINPLKATYNHFFLYSTALALQMSPITAPLEGLFAPLRAVFFDVWRVACRLFATLETFPRYLWSVCDGGSLAAPAEVFRCKWAKNCSIMSRSKSVIVYYIIRLLHQRRSRVLQL